MSAYTEDVGMARRHRYGTNPVAARQRKMLVQGVGFTLLIAVAAFMVFMAVTAT
jgi:hypothetical protein